MSDFIAEVVAGAKPQPRSIEFDGVSGEVHVRKLTGQQKLALVAGKKFTVQPGQKGVDKYELDLGDNEREQQRTVQFCICRADGKDRFRTIEDVQVLPAGLIAALYKVAREFNQAAEATEEETGEA